jgi:hypothetical protein
MLAITLLLSACGDRAAAVPGDALRVVPPPTQDPNAAPTPRARTQEPMPPGWAARFCRVKRAVDVLADTYSDMWIFVNMNVDPRIKRGANEFTDTAIQAETDLRKLPLWEPAQPLVRIYESLATQAKLLGRALERVLAGDRSMIRAGATAERAYRKAVLNAVLRTGDILPKLNISCTV